MMKMKNKSIVDSLAILAIFALAAIAMPQEVKADRAGYVTPYNSTRMKSVSSNEDDYNTFTGSTSTYNQPSSSGAPTVYSSSTAPKTTAKSSTTKTTTVTKKATVEDNGEVLGEEASDATANAIFGTNGFLPSGLIQWIFFAILILLIVILVRKLTGAEDKYHSEPMKHA
jgi:hypothetical protein